MPTRPSSQCRKCGKAIATPGYCAEHKREPYQRMDDTNRPSAAKRGYGGRWRKLREMELRRKPLCAACLKAGRTTPATELDHIVPHRGDAVLFWAADNRQSLCKSCHSAKTVKDTARALQSEGGWTE